MSKLKKRAYSGRGGEREGAGRPKSWIHTPSIAVRVPEPLKEQILAYAKELDNGSAQNQTDVSEQLLGILTNWQSKLEGKESQPRWSNVNKLLIELQSILTPPNED